VSSSSIRSLTPCLLRLLLLPSPLHCFLTACEHNCCNVAPLVCRAETDATVLHECTFLAHPAVLHIVDGNNECRNIDLQISAVLPAGPGAAPDREPLAKPVCVTACAPGTAHCPLSTCSTCCPEKPSAPPDGSCCTPCSPAAVMTAVILCGRSRMASMACQMHEGAVQPQLDLICYGMPRTFSKYLLVNSIAVWLHSGTLADAKTGCIDYLCQRVPLLEG
jgi:hypothetical protein